MHGAVASVIDPVSGLSAFGFGPAAGGIAGAVVNGVKRGLFSNEWQWYMTLIVFAFAFSSVLGNYAYADANLTFLGAGRSS